MPALVAMLLHFTGLTCVAFPWCLWVDGSCWCLNTLWVEPFMAPVALIWNSACAVDWHNGFWYWFKHRYCLISRWKWNHHRDSKHLVLSKKGLIILHFHRISTKKESGGKSYCKQPTVTASFLLLHCLISLPAWNSIWEAVKIAVAEGLLNRLSYSLTKPIGHPNVLWQIQCMPVFTIF